MVFLFALVFFVLGLIIGSFLNVVIFRMNTARSLGGRSACMSCMNKLSWYELIPLFSFLGLKGRCRNCKSKISIQYPIVEFLTGLIFLLLFLKFQNVFFISTLAFSIAYIYYAFMFSLLLVIATYDLKHKIIPDKLSLLFGALAFVGLFFFANYGLPMQTIFYPHIPAVSEFLSGIIIAFPFAFFWLVSSGRWMGLGDAKLAVGIGWLLGIISALSGLVLAFWSGAIVGILLVIISKIHRKGRMGMKSEIPFAPFLVFGALLAFIFGLNFFAF